MDTVTINIGLVLHNTIDKTVIRPGVYNSIFAKAYYNTVVLIPSRDFYIMITDNVSYEMSS